MKGTRADQGQRLAACPVSTLTARYDPRFRQSRAASAAPRVRNARGELSRWGRWPETAGRRLFWGEFLPKGR